MTKEELLKEIMKLPKAETDNTINTMNRINIDDLMSAIDRLNKVPTYDDLLKENKKLKEALEAKSYCKYANKCDEFDDCSREEYEDMANANMKLSVENCDLKDENQKLKEEVINLSKEVGRWNSYYDDEFNENLKLKKQLEECGHHLKCSKEMLEIQGQKGNYDYDEYMLGLYNGMEYIIALFETREPNYISGKDVEFTNNKIQQKEFIKYLEDEKDRLSGTCDIICVSKFEEADDNLQEYKRIIGDD